MQSIDEPSREGVAFAWVDANGAQPHDCRLKIFTRKGKNAQTVVVRGCKRETIDIFTQISLDRHHVLYWYLSLTFVSVSHNEASFLPTNGYEEHEEGGRYCCGILDNESRLVRYSFQERHRALSLDAADSI